ncbi:methyltransferase domain-containing protein [Angustibacter sp. McL0619]|uniref:class I SAM-dependent methyltransferase n=1 Tax=Angustibacter sp. McL0619 TaxID=3415676 RepID=UPI003CE84AA1
MSKPAPRGTERTAQLAYSEQMAAMRDEDKRRRKAAKILAVLRHVLGRSESEELSGLAVADIGCSQGFIADELALAGAATTYGVDIDVPGLAVAQSRFGERVRFVCAAGEALPLADESVDVAVFNHIYEHVVDPDAVLADVRRVLKPDGVLYLGLGNRLGVIEPHYKLPFLSYLPQGAADRYVRAFGRADHYYEQYRTRPGLRKMLADWSVLDYTLPVLAEPAAFADDGQVPGLVTRLPEQALAAMLPLLPTYLWVASPSPLQAKGPALRVAPREVRTKLQS